LNSVRQHGQFLLIFQRATNIYTSGPVESQPENPRMNITIDNIPVVDIITNMAYTDQDIRRLLPLQSSTFYILMALGDGERHGYAIIQDIAERTGGSVKLSAGTLYRSVQRMLEQGLIVESRRRPAPEDDDERRRYYGITAFGSAVAHAELKRLSGLIKLGRAKGFMPGKA
jgi:DNA-binding PadR family transcriptional regulator